MKTNATYRKKNVGQVFTPTPFVRLILDFAGYAGDSVLRKHIVDNSCGEGAFLLEAVHRYCRQFLALSSNKAQLRQELATYIHGVEIDAQTYARCMENSTPQPGRTVWNTSHGMWSTPTPYMFPLSTDGWTLS